MSSNQLEQAGTRWSYQGLALERVRLVRCSGSWQKLCGNLTKTQTHRASKDMEFQVNSTSWRLTALSEFLFNKCTNSGILSFG